MKRNLWLAVIAFSAAASAHAANVQFNKGPICSDNGLTASCSAKLTGLGNGDVDINLSVVSEPVTVETLCKNPKGKASPGQNPADIVDVGGDLHIDASKIKNGSLTFSLSTDEPPAPAWNDAGCPNSQWKASISDVVFSGETIRLTVEQGGVVVATEDYTFP